MFWKKKKKTNQDLTLLGEDKDLRSSYRYVFTKIRQLEFKFKGRNVKALDISAGGMAFTNAGFSQYDADQVTLDLKMPNYPADSVLCVRIRILSITADNVCRSIFENCTQSGYELIHKYVLEMQKLTMAAK